MISKLNIPAKPVTWAMPKGIGRPILHVVERRSSEPDLGWYTLCGREISYPAVAMNPRRDSLGGQSPPECRVCRARLYALRTLCESIQHVLES